MADYHSILNRAISSLPDNNEDARRTIYDKARAALMRQLSSLEPALSPAEISKQRLQLEEAIRDIENQHLTVEDPDEEVADTVSEEENEIKADDTLPDADEASDEKTAAPIVEVIPDTQETNEAPEVSVGATAQEVEAEDPPIEQTTEPDNTPETRAEKTAETSSAPEVVIETTNDPESIAAYSEGDQEAVVESVDVKQDEPVPASMSPELPTTAEPPSDLTAGAEPKSATPASPMDIADEASAAVARVDALKNEGPSALDELKETMREDGVDVAPTAELDVAQSPSSNSDAPEIAIVDELDVVEATPRRRFSGAGLFWIFLVLVLVGTGAFGWAQRESLSPYFEQAQNSISGLLGALNSGETNDDEAAQGTVVAPLTQSKAEDRLLNTPTESSGRDEVAEPEPSNPTDTENANPVEQETTERVALPEENDTPVTLPEVTQITPGSEEATSPDTSDATVTAPPSPEAPPTAVTQQNDGEETETAAVQTTETNATQQEPTAPSTAQPTPTINIFSANAVLYEERKDTGRPDVATGNVVWEYRPTGSEAIGSSGLPSVRGNSRIQDRDLGVRFEIMRNLDTSLPASHLVEIEFQPGPLFGNDNVSNIAGILMKEREQDNGQQLSAVVVKVSQTVFWVALSSRAADLASNVDALQRLKWFDVPIVFESGKRAILTLEKSSAGAKAITQAFEGWQEAGR